MAGYVTTAVLKRTVDFGGLAVGNSAELILADRIDLLSWTMRTMMLRVFSHSLAGGAGTLSIVALAQSISAHDPGTDFIDRLINPTSILLNGSTPSPAYLTADVLNPMVRVVAQASRTGVGALNAIIAVEFSVKDA
jgi:hypothetical protein